MQRACTLTNVNCPEESTLSSCLSGTEPEAPASRLEPRELLVRYPMELILISQLLQQAWSCFLEQPKLEREMKYQWYFSKREIKGVQAATLVEKGMVF